MSGLIQESTGVKVEDRFNIYLDNYYQRMVGATPTEEFKQKKKHFEIHRDRVKLSAQYISDLIEAEKPRDVLVVGDKTIVDSCLEETNVYTNINVTYATYTLEGGLAYPDCSFDLVVSLDILAHIKDHSKAQRDLFVFSGVYHFIGQCNRVLKPGKNLLLVTPNACSLKALCRIFTLKHPFVSKAHVREYTPKEIAYILEICNFDIEHLETHDVWDNVHGQLSTIEEGQHVNWAENKVAIENILKNTPFPDEFRGDEMFIIARRIY